MTTDRQRINIASGSPYEATFGYCRAVRIGDTIHVAGTCAPAGNESADTYVQAQAAIAVIATALEQAGATLRDVVRTVVYVKDIADEALVARAHSEAFGTIRPASTLVQVVALLRPWHRVEVEAYAILGGTPRDAVERVAERDLDLASHVTKS